MKEEFKDKVARVVTVSLLLIIAVGGVVSLAPAYRQANSLKRKNAELARKIEEKKREIARLIECQRRFKTDPDVVERIARQNGRVYPGELVFVFDD